MNDVMEQIKTLSATLDEETTRFHPTGKLLLLGSYESVFLKAVKHKADLLGIDCDLTQYPCPPYKAVVVDRETVPSDITLIVVSSSIRWTSPAPTAVVGSGTTFWKDLAIMFLTRSELRKTTGMVRTWFLTTSRQSSLQTTP